MTTGERSLNNRIHGAIQALKEQSKHGASFEEIKRLFKELSAKEDGFPIVLRKMRYKGKIVTIKEPRSLSGASTEIGMILMNTIQVYADENELYLIDYDEDEIPYRTVGGRTPEEMKEYIAELYKNGEEERARILEKPIKKKIDKEPEIW